MSTVTEQMTEGSPARVPEDLPHVRQSKHVLCVDLDGTLVKTDLLLESILSMIRRRPYYVFLLALWVLRGRAYLKARVSAAEEIDVEVLPYRQELLAFLREQRASQRELVLATASHVRAARNVADYLGIFAKVIATEHDRNLKGERKAQALREAYPHGYAYAGNSRADLPVWEHAVSAVLVDVPAAVRSRMPPKLAIEGDWTSAISPTRGLWRALRPHQWVKNLLIAVPLLTAHRYGSAAAVIETIAAVAAMCLVASSIYLINDLLDLPSDRRHPAKRFRPLASGDLQLAIGLAAIPCLWLGAALICAFLPTAFAGGVAIYAGLAIAYSFWAKWVMWLDVAWLASLYSLRIALGAMAITVPVSGWLLAFSICGFLSLALLKRYTEVDSLRNRPGVLRARAYGVYQRDGLKRVGQVTALLAGVVLLLYVNSAAVRALYSTPLLLWPVAALLFFYLVWTWHMAVRGKMHEDPVLFAIRAPTSYLVLAACLGFIFAAR